uniref:Cytochrome c oxidase subunit 2 n=1 Tax=Quadristernoseta cf. longigynium XFX-2019 TaxID=2695872 RepID=A0A6B9WEI8_9ACAR|nr:cytochrome oxidase subunit 2 [Quadristernoseta cf. longigynium XFX-2019]
MPIWSNIMFPNANSPIMEQLLFFHDHSMIIIILITILIMYMMANTLFNSLSSRFILQGQEIETIWTILPAIMLIFIAIPSLRLLYLMEETFSPSITLKIIGHQWYWSYEYPNFNIEFDSFMIPENDMMNSHFRLLDVDNRIILPFKMNTRLLITSMDVIHSWTIPSLGIKVDAVPGRLNQLFSFPNRPGLYYGQCSEICGANHSFMPISMEITSSKNFINWVMNM